MPITITPTAIVGLIMMVIGGVVIYKASRIRDTSGNQISAGFTLGLQMVVTFVGGVFELFGIVIVALQLIPQIWK